MEKELENAAMEIILEQIGNIKCIAVINADTENVDANIFWSQWDFDCLDKIAKLDLLNDIAGLVERKKTEVRKEK